MNHVDLTPGRRRGFAPNRTVVQPVRAGDEPEPLRVLRMLRACRYLYVGDTPGQGVGVFAAKPFAAGSVLVSDEDGTLYARCMTLADALAAGYDRQVDLFQLGPDLYLPPRGCFDDLFNHCCEPSCGWMMTPLGARFVALRDLAAGDQLTYDYSTYLIGDEEQMACACGVATCRRVIRGFDSLPEVLRDRYRRLRVCHPAALEAG